MSSDPCRPSGIVVVGGGNVEVSQESYVTKGAIARYLHELSDEFGSVTWIAQSSGTWGLPLDGQTSNLQGLLDERRVRTIPVEIGPARMIYLSRLLLRESRRHDFAMFFLPASMLLGPAIRVVRSRLLATASYVGGDYFEGMTELSAGRWMGYRHALRFAHLLVFRSTDLVVARGRKLASIARRYNPEVIETIPLGSLEIDLADDSDRTARTPRRLLYIGIVSESKGIGVLLEAIAALASSGKLPGVMIDIVGDGPELARFQSLAESLGIAEQVEFAGWVDHGPVLDRYFARADLLVMPSSTHPEGVPRVIDEAIARRLPVVATRVGGVTEEFSGGEIRLAEPSSVTALATAIRELMTDLGSRSAMLAAQAERRDWLLSSGSAAKQHATALKQLAVKLSRQPMRQVPIDERRE